MERKLIILVKRYLSLEAEFRQTEGEGYLTKIKETREQITSLIRQIEGNDGDKRQTLIKF